MKILSNVKVTALTIFALTTASISPLFAQGVSIPDIGDSIEKEVKEVEEEVQKEADSVVGTKFPDIANNVYAEEIQKAFDMEIVEGFPDGTFRPKERVTREQAAVMVVKAIEKVAPIDLKKRPREFPAFSDLPEDRWSADYVYWLQSNLFPANAAQLTGNFRPEAPITRVAMVEFLKWTAEYVSIALNASAELVETEEAKVFSDVYGADKVVTMQMSAFCNVASPLNEKGDKFAPLNQARRDYVSAAIVRAVNCGKK